MNIKLIDSFIKNLNERLSHIEKIEGLIVQIYQKKEEIFKNLNGELSSELIEKTKSFISHEFDTYISKITNLESDIVSTFSQEQKNELKFLKPEPFEVQDEISKCHYQVTDLMSQINNEIFKLNNFDFNAAHPMDVIEIKKSDNPKKLSTELLLNDEVITYESREKTFDDFYRELTYDFCRKILIKLRTLEKVVARYKELIVLHLQSGDFTDKLEELKQSYLSLEAQLAEKIKDANIDRFIIQQDDRINENFFHEIEREGIEGKIDTIGTKKFNELITIGSFQTKIVDNKHLGYLQNSKYLSDKLVDGNLSIPYALNLKKNGNILIDVNEEGQYSKSLFEFIHHLILDFLFSFPAGRLNLCLFDVDDVGNFSKYTRLNQINNGIIYNGITRDESRIDQGIKDLESLMHNIFDNKISYSISENIFEYNEKSVANPQNFHLVVILNYPKGFRNDINQRLLKLVTQGNKSGIYTIIVNNNAIKSNNAYDDNARKEFIETLKKSMNYITCRNGVFSVDVDKKNIFKPFDMLRYDNMIEHFDLLQAKAKSESQVSIPLEKMFEYSAKMEKEKKTENPSVIIDIPIGMRGGDVTTLKFSTSGSGSAHTVIIGGTGSGKSNLLHTIVLSACERYSPNDLHLYIVDFKGGVEFKYYEANGDTSKQLPHVKLTGLTSDPEDGVAILENIRNILHAREKEFRDKNAEDIVQYNLKNTPKVPRLLVMIDEVQELFERNESLGQYAINIMSELFKKGRAFGISLLWASQNVPKVAGLRDKVISQIGNRISLRLNNHEDAAEIDIDPKSVKALNKPEKGLGIIKEMASGEGNVEFRVAYAETLENRAKYSQRILNKWAKEKKDGRKLFVVGNSEIAKPFDANTMFTKEYTDKDIQSLSNDNYSLDIGQNFISGDNFIVPLAVRGSKENLWIAGSSTSELRSVMSFALLSTVINNKLNKDITSKEPIYYISGELEDQRLDNNILFKLPRLLPNHIKNIGNQKEIVDLFIKLLKERRNRTEDIQKVYDPMFVFVHKIQAFSDLFKDTFKTYDVSDNPQTFDGGFGSSAGGGFSIGGLGGGLGSPLGMGSSSGGNTKMSFAAIFNEVFGRGPDVGIHVILSIDTPSSISEIEKELRNCAKKVILRGVKQEDLMMINSGRQMSQINYNGIGYFVDSVSSRKIKIYNYNNDKDLAALEEFTKKLGE